MPFARLIWLYRRPRRFWLFVRLLPVSSHRLPLAGRLGAPRLDRAFAFAEIQEEILDKLTIVPIEKVEDGIKYVFKEKKVVFRK